MDNKNVQLVLQRCCKMSRIEMLYVLPPTDQICLATNQVTAGCEALSQKVEKNFTFCYKICKCCAFYPSTSLVYWSTANFFVSSDVNPTDDVTPA